MESIEFSVWWEPPREEWEEGDVPFEQPQTYSATTASTAAAMWQRNDYRQSAFYAEQTEQNTVWVWVASEPSSTAQRYRTIAHIYDNDGKTLRTIIEYQATKIEGKPSYM